VKYGIMLAIRYGTGQSRAVREVTDEDIVSRREDVESKNIPAIADEFIPKVFANKAGNASDE
jgi:hypothetical protein